MDSSSPALVFNDALNMHGSSGEGGQVGSLPILLLKTKSTPHDGYEEYFSVVKAKDGKWSYEPAFVPVLEHRFAEEALGVVRGLLEKKEISKSREATYGGLIFTSQRAVEAFATVVEDEQNDPEIALEGWPHLQDVPVYTVGPATSRALKSISQTPPLNVFGSETGNSDALASYIFEHYGNWYADRPWKQPLLFLVGEQRRDIIPKTLMNPVLPKNQQIPVDELVVYETGVMETFERDFGKLLQVIEDRVVRWVVVFSPTGCEAMLRTLNMLDTKTGRVKTGERGGGCGNRKGKGRRTYIATIGPTTRDYLRKSFGFEPDVCAKKPSPEGIGEAISSFMNKNHED